MSLRCDASETAATSIGASLCDAYALKETSVASVAIVPSGKSARKKIKNYQKLLTPLNADSVKNAGGTLPEVGLSSFEN